MYVIGIINRAQLGPMRSMSRLISRSPVSRTVSLPTAAQLPFRRFAATNAKPKYAKAAAEAPKPAFGEGLCVYHAGTGRVTFMACYKITTLFIFAFFGFVATPAYYKEEGLSNNVIRTALSATVPLAITIWFCAPFVAFVRLRLPAHVRRSGVEHGDESLRHFLRRLPGNTELEIVTMSLISKPRVAPVRVEELRHVSRRFGVVNFARDATEINARRKWYMFRAPENFSIQSTANKAGRHSWAWDEIEKHISRPVALKT